MLGSGVLEYRSPIIYTYIARKLLECVSTHGWCVRRRSETADLDYGGAEVVVSTMRSMS